MFISPHTCVSQQPPSLKQCLLVCVIHNREGTSAACSVPAVSGLWQPKLTASVSGWSSQSSVTHYVLISGSYVLTEAVSRVSDCEKVKEAISAAISGAVSGAASRAVSDSVM